MISTSAVLLRRLTLFDDTLKNLRSGLDKGPIIWNRKNKRMLGRSIDERPALVDEREELGHWEADTVVGKRQGRGAVVFTMVERITDHYIAIKIPGRNSAGIMEP